MFRFVLFSLAAIWVFQGTANASNCSMDEYNHNGSIMEGIVCDGGAFNIAYVTPRRGIQKQGVRSGTLLFEGFEGRNGQISGTARLFSRRCGVITYSVSGRRRGNGNIVLSGRAPRRNKGCQVTGYRNDQLVFNLRGGSVGGPGGGGGGGVQPTCPPGYIFDGSSCIVAGQPGGGAGSGWYAIAGSFPNRNAAVQRSRQLGGSWRVMNTRDCPNFRNGYWIATVGPVSRSDALAWADSARHFGANIKSCY